MLPQSESRTHASSTMAPDGPDRRVDAGRVDTGRIDTGVDRDTGSEGSGRLIGLGERSIHDPVEHRGERPPQARAGFLTWAIAVVIVLAVVLLAWWIMAMIYRPKPPEVAPQVISAVAAAVSESTTA
jgi:hypothetical protein